MIDYSYQDRDVQRIGQRFAAGVQGLLYVLPTGGGKTHVAVRVMLAEIERGGSVLFVAHRRELVGQAVQRLVEAGVDLEAIGVIMAKDKRERPDARIQVASVHTLSRREKPKATLVVFDEAHHSAAKTWRCLVDLYPAAQRLGLTATPYRFDGKGLGHAFDEIVNGPSMDELFAYGPLAPPRAWSIDTAAVGERLKTVRTVAGDYDRKQLARAMNKPAIVGSLVAEYEKHGGGQRAVVFAVDIDHAKVIRRQFRKAGYTVEHLDSETPLTDRSDILARLATGKTQIVTNCEILTEGWDCKPAKVCIMARPTKSTGLYLQMVGRFLRAWRNVRPVILDHAGNAIRHGLPQMTREASLEDGIVKRRKGSPPCKVCPECDAVIPAGTLTCQECGHEFKAREVEERAGKLVAIGLSEDQKAEALERIRKVAAEKGLGEGWIQNLYRAVVAEAA